MEDVLQDRTIVLGREKSNPPIAVSRVELFVEPSKTGGIKQKTMKRTRLKVDPLPHIHIFSLVVALSVIGCFGRMEKEIWCASTNTVEQQNMTTALCVCVYVFKIDLPNTIVP